MIRVQIDPENALGRALTEIERSQLPFAALQAVNETAFQVRKRWTDIIPSVFDRPVALTKRAVLIERANRGKPEARIFLRENVPGGTAPAKYLQAHVTGGPRGEKSAERAAQRRGILPAGLFWVPGRGARLNQYGNLPRGQVQTVLAQAGMGGNADAAPAKVRGRRRELFAATGDDPRTRHLQPGVYERLRRRGKTTLRSILIFVRRPTYRPRFDIYKMAETIYRRRFPEVFRQQLERAVKSARSVR